MKRILALIPLIGIAAIPQLLYFWLAPDVACALAAYLYGTVMTLLHLGGAYALYTVFGLRKAAAPVLVGTVLWVLLLTAASCLMAHDAALRTAIFALTIGVLIYVVVMVPLISAVIHESEDSGPTAMQSAGFAASAAPAAPRGPVPEQTVPAMPARAAVNRPVQRTLPPPLPVK